MSSLFAADPIFTRALADFHMAKGKGLAVHTPLSGELLHELTPDDPSSVAPKAAAAKAAQRVWQQTPRAQREALLQEYAAALKSNLPSLAQMIVLEAGKTYPEAKVEVMGAANVIGNTMTQLAKLYPRHLPEPLGVVGLITSFNFPFAVAHWTLAPALLAGNSVLWKPSEKTPLVAHAAYDLLRRTIASFNVQHDAQVPTSLVQIISGGRVAGEAMVAHEDVCMISATGSVAMGKAIQKTLAHKKHPAAPSVLELGGNNAAIISQHLTPEALEIAVSSVFFSALASSGQRCTDTRRLLVHRVHYNAVLAMLKARYQQVLDEKLIGNPLSLPEGKEGFGPLIDEDAFSRYLRAAKSAFAEGGTIHSGSETFSAMPNASALRLHEKLFPHAYYVKPLLAAMPAQKEGGILCEETFAPILYLLPYDDFEQALGAAFAPLNAGLVQALYSLNQDEIRRFTQGCPAGHAVVNSRTGTGTPAHGLGFGGCRDSGEGEILGLDPLLPFTKNRADQKHTLPTEEAPEVVTDNGITRTKYILTRPDGTRTRVVIHSL